MNILLSHLTSPTLTCLCACVHARMPMCVYVHACACPPYATVNWELEDSLQEIWVLGLNSGDQSWLQVPFPLSHLVAPPKSLFNLHLGAGS